MFGIKSIYKASFLSIFGSGLLFADSMPKKNDDLPPPPQVIEAQLTGAELEFDEARKMFNPWYAGPLLTASAHIIPPGYANVQPYLFVTDNYGHYTESGKSVDNPHLIQVNPNVIMQIGVLDWLQTIVSVQGFYNTKNDHGSTNFGDTNLSLGFGIQPESAYLPAILFSLKETFPTGKYEHLSSNKGGVDATGAGSYQTTFTLNVSKVVWWVTLHPMNLRLSLNYTIPSTVKVEGFNNYGGGYMAHAKVRPGNTFAGNIGYEYSFTQKWVAACDFVYTYSSPTQYTGYPGVDKSGQLASIGGPFNDQLSLAPALEYNPNQNLGFIAGVWFTIWGRNSLSFASGILSFTLTF